MTTKRDLLEAIVAAPDDDAPRLVYADWLLEHDPSHEKLAHTIIAQCMVAACEARGDWRSLEYRRARHAEARLELQPSYAWPYRVGVLLRSAHRKRGFLTHLHLPLEQPIIDFVPGLPLESIHVAKEGGVTVADLRPTWEIGKRSPVREVAVSCAFGTARFDAAGLFELFEEGLSDTARVWGAGAAPLPPFFEHVVSLGLREGTPTSIALPRRLRHLRLTGDTIDPNLLAEAPALAQLEVYDASEDNARDVIGALKVRVGANRLTSLTLTSFHWRDSSPLPHVWSRAVTDDFAEAGLRDGLEHLTASFPIDHHAAMANYETLSAAGGFHEGAMGSLGFDLRQLIAFRLNYPEELADTWLVGLSDLAVVRADLTGGALEKLACDRFSELSSLSLVHCKYWSDDDARAFLTSPRMAGVPTITMWPRLENETYARNASF